MSRKPRNLTEADRAQWADYAADIRPLGALALPSPPKPQAAAGVASLPTPRPRVPAQAMSPLTIGEAPGGVDRSTWDRFRSGKLVPARTLDLHGYTAQQAFHELTQFLDSARADGLRCVEVVTGRGSRGEGGVIRREFRQWLNLPNIRSLVLAAAHPHAANPGAVRLLLRRARSA